jgi:hypothetical protein
MYACTYVAIIGGRYGGTYVVIISGSVEENI